MLMGRDILTTLMILPVLIIALTIHELCHGYAAYLLGDMTAKRDGRLSLNPIRHIDPLGLLMIIVVGFGWAKPVMVNPYNLRNPKVDMALIAIAGPISNFVMAFFSILIAEFVFRMTGMPRDGIWHTIVNAIILLGIINIMLGVFNLLPIPPLDGSKVIAGILPDHIYRRLPPVGIMGMIILMVLMFTGILGRILMTMVSPIIGTFSTIALWFVNLIL